MSTNDNNKNLQKLLKVFNTDNIITPDEIKQVITAIASMLATYKEGTQKVNQQTTGAMQQALETIKAENQRLRDEINNEVGTTTKTLSSTVEKQLKDALAQTEALMQELRDLELKDGIDGEKGDKGEPGKDGSPDTRQQIVEKINTGGPKDLKIKAIQIDGLPKFTREVIREVGGHAGAMETPIKDATTGRLLAKDASGAWLITASASQWTTSGSDIYYNTGNVGIGTTTPTFKLDVNQSASNTVPFRVIGLDTNAGVRIDSAIVQTSSRNWLLGVNTQAYGDFNITTSTTQGGDPKGGTSRFYIDPSGNVGINTTSPSSLLDVQGNTNASGRIIVRNTNTAAAAQTAFLMYNANATFTAFYKNSATAASDPNAFFFDADSGASTVATIFQASGVERMRITTSGYLSVASYVSAASYGTGGNGGASQGMSFSGTTTNINGGGLSGNINFGNAGNGSAYINITGSTANVGIVTSLSVGTNTMSASALFEIVSTTKGFLPPRMTTAQRTAIASPAEGLHVYDLTTHSAWYYNGTNWLEY